jgi:hypothetical protein
LFLLEKKKEEVESMEGEKINYTIGWASMTTKALLIRGLCVFLTPFKCSQGLFLE